MLDIKLIRNDPKLVEEKLKTKDPSIDLKPILALDDQVRHLKTQVEELKNKRNLLSKEIGEKKRAGQDTASLMKEVSGLGEKITEIDHELTEKESTLLDLVAHLPNLPSDRAKISQDVQDNVVINTFKENFLFSSQKSRRAQRNSPPIRLQKSCKSLW